MSKTTILIIFFSLVISAPANSNKIMNTDTTSGATTVAPTPANKETDINNDNEIIAKGAKVEKLAEGFRFTEGPAVDKKGNV